MCIYNLLKINYRLLLYLLTVSIIHVVHKNYTEDINQINEGKMLLSLYGFIPVFPSCVLDYGFKDSNSYHSRYSNSYDCSLISKPSI